MSDYADSLKLMAECVPDLLPGTRAVMHDAAEHIAKLEAAVVREREANARLTSHVEELEAENERMRGALKDADRVLEWGVPYPKPALGRVRAVLDHARKEHP